jgi:hypothetical protein
MKDIKQELKLRYEKHDILLQNIKSNMSTLEELYNKYSDGFGCEDRIYRFYHYSFKVYWMQDWTREIVDILRKMSPHNEKELIREGKFSPFCPLFDEIMNEGTGWEFSRDHNKKWSLVTRPIIEAFFHAKYFLEMSIKYGKELEEAPQCMPSGWAALTELYNIR